VIQSWQNPHPDPDLQLVEAALRRSGLRARELARATNTGLVVMIDGELRTMRGAELDRAMETSGEG
jgi:hypothetical protein